VPGQRDLAAQARVLDDLPTILRMRSRPHEAGAQNILVVRLARIPGRSPLKSGQTGQILNARIIWDSVDDSGPAFLPTQLKQMTSRR
jgi:hypothetical protein